MNLINSKILETSKFLNVLSSKTEIKNIDIEEENIDDIIVKLYEEFEL